MMVRETHRLTASAAASAVAHALVIAALVLVAPAPVEHPARLLPVSLVSLPGGGDGRPPGEPAGGETAPEAVPTPAPPPAAVPPLRRVARPHPAPRAAAARPPAPVAPAAAGGAGVARGAGGMGGGTGGGGTGGDGSGGARPAYGTNPLPHYPRIARRLGKEGVVLLDVVVAPDGRATDVRVVRSAGFAPLDESAATTVRDRWRFVPARRGGVPVESRVRVPIRFRLTDASG